jgi:hypothetical protein
METRVYLFSKCGHYCIKKIHTRIDTLKEKRAIKDAKLDYTIGRQSILVVRLSIVIFESDTQHYSKVNLQFGAKQLD